MQQQGLMDSTEDFQTAFALTAQVSYSCTIPGAIDSHQFYL